ncbi:putative COP9 signalosome complex subunit 1 [Apostichopus japonicus]|uniref:Putative COP9 signalosome complex subunit 1 n=1 Tax=Stichopus japonicus TaxID=307972 RepID=A0A2G8JUK2_STIJA|nr:putative COP9 signalosome complex subunit 1 [Apostichopus japonicus]
MQLDLQPEGSESQEELSYTVDSPTLDLEAHAVCYSGFAKINRLLFIAARCPALRVEALRMALNYTQTTYNTQAYQHIHSKLAEAVTSSSLLPDAVAGVVHNIPSLDTNWIETTNKKAALKLEKLDTDLKNYKANSIKESIRRGHDDLGDHYLDLGDLSNALKCYSRARDYCTSPKHIINMCLNVIKVSIHLKNWSHVLSYVTKAESSPELTEKDSKDNMVIVTKLKCAAGVAELATKKYKPAAKYFLQASFDHCDFPELFKLFLELEPQLRDIIFMFYQSKYASCLKLLDEIKDNLLLDMYLATHVATLYSQIRNRALIQYFSPYVSADMHKMAIAFNTTVPALEDELMHLILDGQINARIDSHNKILYARDVDQRCSTFEKSLAMGLAFQRRTKALILRSAMLKNDIQVKSPVVEGSNSGGDNVSASAGASPSHR